MAMSIPRFMQEGYGVCEKGKPIVCLGLTGLKPDAPQWAHDEFVNRVRELQKRQEEGSLDK